MRDRVRKAVKAAGARKCTRTLALVGCSTAALRAHLEAQFAQGMSWDNHGKWHIDHIRPCASFNLQHASDQRACFHFTNLQPLWATDNLKKSSWYAGKRHLSNTCNAHR